MYTVYNENRWIIQSCISLGIRRGRCSITFRRKRHFSQANTWLNQNEANLKPKFQTSINHSKFHPPPKKKKKNVVLQIDFQQALSSPLSKKLRSNWKLDAKSVPSCTMGTASNIRNPSVPVMDLRWKDVKMELWDPKLRNSLHDSWFMILKLKITIFSRICLQPFQKQEQCFLKVIWKSNVALSRESPSTLEQNSYHVWSPVHIVKWSAWCLKSFPQNYHQLWTYCMTIMSNVMLFYVSLYIVISHIDLCVYLCNDITCLHFGCQHVQALNQKGKSFSAWISDIILRLKLEEPGSRSRNPGEHLAEALAETDLGRCKW